MNLTRPVWRELFERKGRLLTSFVAIILGVTVIVSIKNISFYSEKAVAGKHATLMATPERLGIDDQSPKSEGQKSIQQNGESGFYTFLVFWKDQDAKTGEMIQTVQNTLADDGTKNSTPAKLLSINIQTATEKPLVDQYDASRAPMPLLLAIAPNGAITKAFIEPFTQGELIDSFVSPATTAMLKALQENQLVFVCIGSSVNPDGTLSIPKAVSLFKTDPGFAAATVIVPINSQDVSEHKLIESLEIKPDSLTEPIAIMLAPPNMILGQFTSKSTKDEIIQSLKALQSGSCGPNGCGPGGCGPAMK